MENYKKIENIINTCITARKRKNLTQKDVSEMTGLTQQMVSRIETMASIPSIDTFLLYLKALELNLEVIDYKK